MERKPQYATITLIRSYRVPPSQVFAEFANPIARACWSTPSEDVLIYNEADFRTDGRDIFRCCSKDRPKFSGETRYLVIVPDRRVVASETLDADGQRISVCLNTQEFDAAEDGTILTMTLQIVSFAGLEVIHKYESENKIG